MENKKINIAEILEKCPSGMELNCTIYENVEFDLIDTTPEVIYPIHCLIKTNVGYESLLLTSDGCINRHSNAKCVIFPENKTTWEGFEPLCTFKDGDIISCPLTTCIFKKERTEKGTVDFYCGVVCNEFTTKDINEPNTYFGYIADYRLATEEEKQKLFKAIKDNGYKWNAETKTLKLLIKPEFKVKDIIKNKYTGICNTVLKVCEDYYIVINLDENEKRVINFNKQHDWELIPNKFDISTLVPFETKVLVRDYNDQIWRPAIFGIYIINKCYYITVGGFSFKQLIPYENNEHLLGTTNDCKEYYKIWKE